MSAIIDSYIQSKINHLPKPEALAATAYAGRVVSIQQLSDQTHYALSVNQQSMSAVAAESLLVQVEEGDLVYCLQAEGELFITQILQRAKQESPFVMHSKRPMEWVAPVIKLKALKNMELLSVEKITLSSSDIVMAACRTLVQQAKNFIQQASHYSLKAKGLMQLSGRQQVIVAEEDIRMDAKRINMG